MEKNNHKEYLKGMLVRKMMKLFPGTVAVERFVEGEVGSFVA